MNATTYGLDIAKRVFQMYWVDAQTGEIANRRFGRDDLIAFLAERPAGRVALEACGSAHWWARKIRALGHEVVLLHAQFIRPFVQTNKTDVADAKAIWTAVQQPGMRTVAAKTEDQQATLSLHRMRSQLIKFRTMQVNQLRGFLYEFGVTFRAGRLAGLAEVRERTAQLEDTLPRSIILNLQDQRVGSAKIIGATHRLLRVGLHRCATRCRLRFKLRLKIGQRFGFFYALLEALDREAEIAADIAQLQYSGDSHCLDKRLHDEPPDWNFAQTTVCVSVIPV
jgi:transposase